MNLLELQRRMAEDVRRPLTAEFAMQRESEDGVPVAEIAAAYVKPNDRLTSFERLEIYNRQYWFRVLGALEEDYPALQAVVGARRFQALAQAYLREHPSTSFTLRNLGAKLPEWLETHAEFAGRRHRLALDVARLEWAYVEAFDGAAVAPLTEADFAGLRGDSTLELQPHVQLLALSYPVDELVLAVHQASPAGDMMSNAVAERRQTTRMRLPAMRQAKVYLAVHRFADAVYYRRLEREAYRLLLALQKRLPLEEAIVKAFSESKLSVGQLEKKIEQYFAHAAGLGWFSSQGRY